MDYHLPLLHQIPATKMITLGPFNILKDYYDHMLYFLHISISVSIEILQRG